MRKLLALIVLALLAALLLSSGPAAADASAPIPTLLFSYDPVAPAGARQCQQASSLTIAAARCALRSYATAPQVSELRIGQCHRVSPARVWCPTTFLDTGDFTINGQVIPARERFPASAWLRGSSIVCNFEPGLFFWTRCGIPRPAHRL